MSFAGPYMERRVNAFPVQDIPELQVVFNEGIRLAYGNGQLNSSNLIQQFGISDVGNKVGGVVKIHIFIVKAIKQIAKTADPARQVIPAAEGDDAREESGMAHCNVDGMICTHTATMSNKCRVGISVVCERNDLVKDIVFILLVSGYSITGRTPITVETLCVDAVDAAELELAAIDFIPQGRNEPPVFVIEEPSGAGRKNNHPGTALSKKKQVHVAFQMMAMPRMILSIHRFSIQQLFQKVVTIRLIYC